MPTHRKQVRHFQERRELHELTFSCYRRYSLLNDERNRQELARSIDAATERLGWNLSAFVFMPEHVYLLVWPDEVSEPVSRFLFAIKRPCSYRIKKRLEAAGDPLLDRLTVRQRPGVTAFRFWQEGPGYDRNLRSERALCSSIDYIHRNPVTRGLVERGVDWKWSSARWYASDQGLTDPGLPRLKRLPAEVFLGRGDVSG